MVLSAHICQHASYCFEAFCPPPLQFRSRRDITYCVQYVLFRFTSTALASGVSQSSFYMFEAASCVRDAIALSYEARGFTSPLGIRVHSTRGIASSIALARGIPLQQVCDAESWSSPHTFANMHPIVLKPSVLRLYSFGAGETSLTVSSTCSSDLRPPH